MIFPKLDSKWDLLRLAREVQKSTGKSVKQQLTEALALRRSESRLGLSEYYDYRLYEERFDEQRRRTFAGERLTYPIANALNEQSWRCIVNDKLLFFHALDSLGLPTPRIKAVYVPQQRWSGKVTVLAERDELVRYLSSPSSYPFFSKPMDGAQSRGAMLATGFDATTRSLSDAAGNSHDLDTFIDELPRPWTPDGRRTFRGQLFQEPAHPPQEFAQMFGPALSTVRLVVLLHEDGPRVFRASLKIASGDNPADNFWRAGNYLAAIDRASGRTERVIVSTGHGAEPVATEGSDADSRWQDFQVPQWKALCELACRASSAFPGLLMQSWDIAPTDKGPTLVEVNATGDLALLQAVGARGVLDPEFRDFLRSRKIDLSTLR